MILLNEQFIMLCCKGIRAQSQLQRSRRCLEGQHLNSALGICGSADIACVESWKLAQDSFSSGTADAMSKHDFCCYIQS